MRSKTYFAVIALLTVSLAAYADSPAPAPAVAPPTTRPAGPTGSVQGTVAFAGNLDLARPDLSRAVAYFDSDPALDALSANPASAQVAQIDKAFSPNFLAVPKDTLIEFPNWDHISHNVFSRSAAAPAFDLDRYRYGKSKSRVFTKIGVVQVFCNIHPWMRAIIFVTPNRFFTRVGADGKFAIAEVPIGHYQVSVWQERCAIEHAQVDITAAGPTAVAFQLHEDRGAIIANDAPRHETHYGVDRGLGVKRDVLNLPVVTDVHDAPPPATQPCPDCK